MLKISVYEQNEIRDVFLCVAAFIMS